jgi:hypothetical protein
MLSANCSVEYFLSAYLLKIKAALFARFQEILLFRFRSLVWILFLAAALLGQNKLNP